MIVTWNPYNYGLGYLIGSNNQHHDQTTLTLSPNPYEPQLQPISSLWQFF